MELKFSSTFFRQCRDTMKVLYLISHIITFALSDTSRECENCVQIDSVCYNVTHLVELEANFRSKVVINQMGVLRSDDILYYSYEPDIKDQEYSKVGFVNLNDVSKGGIISASNYSLNLAVFDMDQRNRIIYLGGSDGVYKFDMKTNNFEHFSSHGDTILSLFYKDNVYFVRDIENEIIVKKGKEFDSILINDRGEEVKLLKPKIGVKKFVITNDNVVVFLSAFGLYAAQATKDSKLVLLSKNSFFRGLAMDLDGVVYTWWLDGIYKVVLERNLMKSQVSKVADIPMSGGMTFDNANNILLTNDRSLFNLVKTNFTKCTKSGDV